MSETCRGHLWEKIIVKLFVSSWYIFLTSNFTFMWPCIVTYFFIIKPTRCNNFPNLLQHMFWAVPLTIIRSLFTVHSAMVYVIQICRQPSSRTGSCSKAVYKPVWHIPVPSVQWINSWWWAEELPETCRVSCRSLFGEIVASGWFYYKEINNFSCFSWEKFRKSILLRHAMHMYKRCVCNPWYYLFIHCNYSVCNIERIANCLHTDNPCSVIFTSGTSYLHEQKHNTFMRPVPYLIRLGESFSTFVTVIVLLHPEDEGTIIYQNNGNFYPATQCNIREDLNLQQHWDICIYVCNTTKSH